jgi:hypothetical protein
LEVEMSNKFRNSMIAAVVLLAALVAAPACQCDSVEPIKTTKHGVAIELADPDSEYKWKTIPDIDVSSGDTIRFSSKELTVWVLIPDNRFKLVEGGSDWVVSKSFTAFKVEGGYAIVRLDECLDESEDAKEKIHYSIMVRDGKDASGQWDYVHGENPPPRMIIPRKR